MNANRFEIQWGFKLQLSKVKASGEPFDFQEEIYRASEGIIWYQIWQGAFDTKGV